MAKPEICKQCTHENVPESGFPCHLCGYLVSADKSQIGAFKKKQTNADRIRSMSDEELAEFLIRQHACEHCEYHGRNATCKAPSEFTCTNLYAEGITLKWLKSEAKE